MALLPLQPRILATGTSVPKAKVGEQLPKLWRQDEEALSTHIPPLRGLALGPCPGQGWKAGVEGRLRITALLSETPSILQCVLGYRVREVLQQEGRARRVWEGLQGGQSSPALDDLGTSAQPLAAKSSLAQLRAAAPTCIRKVGGPARQPCSASSTPAPGIGTEPFVLPAQEVLHSKVTVAPASGCRDRRGGGWLERISLKVNVGGSPRPGSRQSA